MSYWDDSKNGANYKFKVGDKVRIREDLSLYKSYNGIAFAEEKSKGLVRGTEHIITEVPDNDWAIGYYLSDYKQIIWTDSMLELAEVEEKVEEKTTMTKYQIGDKVVVRKDLQDDRYYSENRTTTDWANDAMVRMAGQTVTIKSIFGKNGYLIEEADFSWVDGMFEGLASEVKVDKKELVEALKEAVKAKPKAEAEVVDFSGGEWKWQLGLSITKVIHSAPATIIFYRFNDDPKGKVRKMVARCLPTDTYDREKGIQVAVFKAMRKLINKHLEKM